MYSLNMPVTAYGRQTVPDRGVVRSCDPLPIISLGRLILKSIVKFCTRVGYINSMQQDDISPTKGRGYGHVTVLKFCRLSPTLSWCSASRGFVSDSWATCTIRDCFVNAKIALKISRSCDFRPSLLRNDYKCQKRLNGRHTGCLVSIFMSTPPSRPNKVGLKCPSARPYVRPSVRTSTKNFFDFNEIRWRHPALTVWSMPEGFEI